MKINHSPLRYPGGKQKLTPFIYEILEQNNLLGGHYVEPYAGGAGVALNLLIRRSVSVIHLNDSCPAIYAFWHSILNEPKKFCRRISKASLTINEWRRKQHIIANPKKFSRFALGFATFYLNRCNRSGILSGGVIGGLEQKGNWLIDARFNRNELINRIETISEFKKYIKIRNWDAEKFISNYVSKLPKKSLIYFDPPYFHKSDRLYLNHYLPEDHKRISRSIQRDVRHPWIISYDNVPEIELYYRKRQSFIYSLQYSAGNTDKGNELFIFSDKLNIPAQSEVPYINKSLNRIFS